MVDLGGKIKSVTPSVVNNSFCKDYGVIRPQLQIVLAVTFSLSLNHPCFFEQNLRVDGDRRFLTRNPGA